MPSVTSYHAVSAVMTRMTGYGHRYKGGMNATGLTNQSWDLRPVPQEETHAWYCESGQECKVGEHLRDELTAAILLSEHNIKRLSEFISLYPQVSAALRCQRSLFV